MRARKQQSTTSACSECVSDDFTLSTVSIVDTPKVQPKPRKKQDVAKALSDLVVYTQAVKFRGFYAGCTSIGAGLPSHVTVAAGATRSRAMSSVRPPPNRKASSVLSNISMPASHQGSLKTCQ